MLRLLECYERCRVVVVWLGLGTKTNCLGLIINIAIIYLFQWPRSNLRLTAHRFVNCMEHLPGGVLSSVIEALQWSYDEFRFRDVERDSDIYREWSNNTLSSCIMGSVALSPHHHCQDQSLQMYVFAANINLNSQLNSTRNHKVFKHKMFLFNLKTTSGQKGEGRGCMYH